MKTMLLVTLAFFACGDVLSQSNFEVTSVGSTYSITQIETALQNIDLCGYYYFDANRILTFDDGAIVQLKKGSEIANLETTCITNESPVHAQETWEIAPNGQLIKRIPTIPAK